MGVVWELDKKKQLCVTIDSGSNVVKAAALNNWTRVACFGHSLSLSLSAIDPPCNCSTSTCSVFSSSLFYLYPFNIEFHIFVSAMLFVMWKNIGRSVETVSAPMPPQGRGLGRGLSVGPVLGCGALACTVGVLVVYLTHVEQADTRQAAVSMFYVYGVVMSLSMCGAACVGLLLYRAQQRPLDTSANPARELDTELLVWSAAGAWLMAWCSVIAVTSGSSAAPHRWISGVYATLLVLETSVQNLFIMESLYRPQECESVPTSEVFSVTCALAPPYGSLRGGIINRGYETQERPLEEPEDSAPVYRRKPSQVPLSADLTPPPRLKRNVLKNIALFLTLANVCLWILPAFGVRPQYDSGLEEDSFGFSVWVSVLNFAVPLNLFYRMHAVASLFEVFRRI
ncbi:unnamed protein product [Knipowitschia caucasica]